jgi:hypothetical protein
VETFLLHRSGFGGKQSIVFSFGGFTTQSANILKIPIITNSVGPRTIFPAVGIFPDPNHQKFPIVDYYQKSKYQSIRKYPRIGKYHDWGVLGEQQHTPSIGRKV